MEVRALLCVPMQNGVFHEGGGCALGLCLFADACGTARISLDPHGLLGREALLMLDGCGERGEGKGEKGEGRAELKTEVAMFKKGEGSRGASFFFFLLLQSATQNSC